MIGSGRVAGGRRWRRTLIGLFAAVVLTFPHPAMADRLDEDRVAGVPLVANEDLRDAAPDVEMSSGILVTMSGKLLWERSASERRPMASTTKIMTCLLVLEREDRAERVTISPHAAAVGGSGIYLWSGETLTVGELLLALMLESSNSAGVVLAEHVSGSESVFVAEMNKRASELGLFDTRYENPHGLDADGHFTSAADLALLARHAMLDPAFRELVATERSIISGTGTSRVLESSNVLLTTYDGATGIKTGWTIPAGYCLVASAERGGVELIAVVLEAVDGDARFVQAEELLDWGFAHYGPVRLASVEETLADVCVSDYLDRVVVARVGEDALADLFDLEGEVRREFEIAAAVEAPVEAGQRLGTLFVYQGDVLIAEVPLVADTSVPKPTFWEKVQVFFVRLWESWFGSGGESAVPATETGA